MEEAYFCSVHLRAEWKPRKILSDLEKLLGSKPYLEEDLFAFSNFECIEISPYEYTDKEGQRIKTYTYPITEPMHSNGYEELDRLIMRKTGLEIPCTIYHVSLTDFPVSFKIIQKVPKERQKNLRILN